MNTIEDLLRSGRTVKELEAEIKEAAAKIEAETVANTRHQEELNDARECLIEDLLNYIEVVTNSEMTEEENDMAYAKCDKMFRSLEKAVANSSIKVNDKEVSGTKKLQKMMEVLYPYSLF